MSIFTIIALVLLGSNILFNVWAAVMAVGEQENGALFYGGSAWVMLIAAILVAVGSILGGG